VLPEEVKGISLAPKGEYVHLAKWRMLDVKPTVPGALQKMGASETASR
jgi:hypothetical protein